jgi:5'-nucleotidase
VTASGVEGLKFTDEVRTANKLVPELRAKGVESIVVLLHERAVTIDLTAYNDCPGASGPALTIAENLSPAIDAVVSGHTHLPYNCTVGRPVDRPRLLTSASSFGRMVTNVHLLLNPNTHDVVRPAAYANNKIVTNTDVQPVAALSRLIARYKELVAPGYRARPTEGPAACVLMAPPDGHLAALALEHGATVVSFDREVARFEGVFLHRPG